MQPSNIHMPSHPFPIPVLIPGPSHLDSRGPSPAHPNPPIHSRPIRVPHGVARPLSPRKHNSKVVDCDSLLNLLERVSTRHKCGLWPLQARNKSGCAVAMSLCQLACQGCRWLAIYPTAGLFIRLHATRVIHLDSIPVQTAGRAKQTWVILVMYSPVFDLTVNILWWCCCNRLNNTRHRFLHYLALLNSFTMEQSPPVPAQEQHTTSKPGSEWPWWFKWVQKAACVIAGIGEYMIKF